MSNRKNPAVKRILADVRELQTHPSSRYFAAPLEDNMFEWHFTIRGPADSAFADGIYHGRILLPTDYPFKPPNIVFLTKNGRFEVGTKICLSISAYHEESWQPAWGVRTMLEAIISFMPSEGMGAIGALDWTLEERKKLAVESKNYVCSLCGKASLLLSDPALDTSPQDPLTLSQQAADAAAMAESIAQLSLKPAKAPHSPHVHANHALSGDLPGVGMAMKSSNFAADMDVGPFSVQEGTSNFDMITTSVSAPPLEDSDGVTDFLPDLDERMLEFDNNNLDAEDNFDCIGPTTNTTNSTTTTNAATTSDTTAATEAERQLALQEIEHARAHLVHHLGSVDRALAAAVDRIQQAEERLAQNLEQVPQDNVQLGGVRAVQVGDNGVNVNINVNVGNNMGERDLVDEWLTVLLIALGTSIALMAWRIVLRYYTLFLF